MADVMEGVLGRVLRKLCFAGLLGLSGGVYATLVYAKPLGPSCRAGFHGCVILMGYFALLQEGSRAVRRTHDPINSWFAGSGAGYILTATQGIRTGLYGGIAVGALHFLKDCIPVGTFRRLLISWDLLDPPEPSAQLEEVPVPIQEDWTPPWWEQYMPLRRISREEAQRRKAEEKQMWQDRVDQMDPPQTRTAEIQHILVQEKK